jgi:glycosyltransferase involved in cell wall biosynthesis
MPDNPAPCSTSDRIDILLSTYNGERFVERQLESIVAQMDDRCRLLIRDDGSSDGTRAIIERFVARYPGRIVQTDETGPRLGTCRSFGRLLAQADADYIVFCDQDDVWLPGHIATPLARIKAVEAETGGGTPVLAHTDLVVVDEHLHRIAPSFWAYSNLNPQRGHRLNQLLVQNVVTGSAMTINRALARLALPIPQGAVLHDWWLALVASAFGRVEAIPEQTVLYRQHGNNVLGATSYGWRYVARRAMQVLCQGATTRCFGRAQGQALALLERFTTRLHAHDKAAIGAFVNLKRAGFFDRRLLMLKHGFLGTGRLRNLGWLMMI